VDPLPPIQSTQFRVLTCNAVGPTQISSIIHEDKSLILCALLPACCVLWVAEEWCFSNRSGCSHSLRASPVLPVPRRSSRGAEARLAPEHMHPQHGSARSTGVHQLLIRQDLCKAWLPAWVPGLRRGVRSVAACASCFACGLARFAGAASGAFLLGQSRISGLWEDPRSHCCSLPRQVAPDPQLIPLSLAGAMLGTICGSRPPLTLPIFQNMPNVRDHDASVYLRLQGDALSVGGYESNPIFWEEVSGAGRFSGGTG